MADIYGICSEDFNGVREALARNLDSGADIGASAAVFIEGEPVVDIWGGYFDEARTQPWALLSSLALRHWSSSLRLGDN
jgi:hypothetical protein